MENNSENNKMSDIEPDVEDAQLPSSVVHTTEFSTFDDAELQSEINNETIFTGCPQKKPANIWLMTTIIIGIYFILSIFVFRIVLEPLEVVGASMFPTLNGGDLIDTTNDVVYLKDTQNYSKLDIVVFKANNYTGEDSLYIKRVIGLPGDVIQFKKNREVQDVVDPYGYLCHEYFLYINGELQKEDYINQEETTTPYAMVLRLHVSPGEADYAKVINEQEIIVGEGELFVLGDNRKISNDSKYFGCIKANDCIGKVVFHIQYGEIIFKAFYRALKKNYLK